FFLINYFLRNNFQRKEMELEVIWGIVKIPSVILEILGWTGGILAILSVLVQIDKNLKALTENKVSLMKIGKGTITTIFNSVNHRNGSRPLPVGPRIRKSFSYLLCIAWGYGCILFSALFISSILMFVLRNNSLPIMQALTALGIILVFGWCAKFAFIETQVAFNEAKSI
ncbi:hypothetical protein, partial [Acinetobacter sp. DSM 11652]|uniref:hypothetical protein n=1 Tax=Acinetobacter sp. DSM 11652 TaxID=346222 RepID=UPI001BB46382